MTSNQHTPQCPHGTAQCPHETSRLERVEPLASGGTVAYRVTLNGRWVGWVGDVRPWRGWRYGGTQWWACWREDGDTAARWNSNDDQPHRTRAAALAALVEYAAERRATRRAADLTTEESGR